MTLRLLVRANSRAKVRLSERLGIKATIINFGDHVCSCLLKKLICSSRRPRLMDTTT